MKKTFSLILPNIRSCHNVGACFRNADAFGVDKIYLVGWTATPPKPQIDKVSLGAETWIPWEQRDSLEQLIEELKADNVQIVGLELCEKSVDIRGAAFSESVALIVGNEVHGIPEEVQALCDQLVYIPMNGKKESLNVSVAAGVAMYEIRKKIDGQ